MKTSETPQKNEPKTQEQKIIDLISIDKKIRDFLDNRFNDWNINKLHAFIRGALKNELEEEIGMEIPWEIASAYFEYRIPYYKIFASFERENIGVDNYTQIVKHDENGVSCHLARDVFLSSAIDIEGDADAWNDSVRTLIDIDCSNIIPPSVKYENNHLQIEITGQYERDHLNFWAKAISCTLGNIIHDRAEAAL